MSGSAVARSDLSFHQKIINKYRMGKSNFFKFPLLIFSKNIVPFSSQNIHIGVFIRLGFQNQYLSYSINKSASEMKRVLLWLGLEKFITQFISGPTFSGKPLSGKSINNELIPTQNEPTEFVPVRLHSLFLSPVQFVRNYRINPTFSRHENVANVFNRVFKTLFLIKDIAIHPQANRQFISYGSEPVKAGRFPSIQKDNIREYPSLLEHTSPVVLPQGILMNYKILSNAAFYSRTFNNLFLYSGTVNRQITVHGGFLQITDAGRYPHAQKDNFREYHSAFEYNSPAILQTNLMDNKTLLNTAFYPQTLYKVPFHRQAVNNQFISFGDYIQITKLQTLRRISNFEEGYSFNNETLLNTAFSPRAFYNISFQDKAVNRQLISYGAPVRTISPEIRVIKTIPEFGIAEEHPSKAESPLSVDQLNNFSDLILISRNPLGCIRTRMTRMTRINTDIESDFTPTGDRTLTLRENVKEYPSRFENRSPAILPWNIMPGNKTELNKSKDIFNEPSQKSVTIIKPVTEHDSYKYRSDAAGFTYPQKMDAIQDNNDDLYFRNHRNLEQAIEQVKKIAQETKETVLKRSIKEQFPEGVDIQRQVDMRQVDISRISDQVYHMIDNRLKIEKERRGYM